jgi:peptidoglycan/xylan/chitin deacetylase (PgdA/CDA1 family)
MAKNEIAITIDDGPSAENNAVVLKILKDHGVTAMFFLVGKEVEKHPELVKNILRAGHPVGIHTWSHPNMPTLPIKAAEEQIDKTYTLLKSIAKELSKEEKKDDAHAYRIQPFFRFPYGAGASALNMQKLLADRNLANFHWSMTTKDSETEDGDVALNTAVGMLTRYGHGVFLMHETHIAGVRSLPYFLQQLKDRNYQTIYFEAAPEAH